MELVVPGLGAVVNLDDPQQVTLALDDVRDLERELRNVKAELTRAIVHAASVRGTKTLHLENCTAIVKGGEAIIYDAEAIEEGLRAAGMPEDRIREIVVETVSYRVAANEAKRAAAANPAYAEVIEANRRVEETATTVTISRTKR